MGTFLSSLAISLLLLLAAIAKWVSPSGLPNHLDQYAAIVETIVAILLLFFRRHKVVWWLVLQMFALWLGYSLYWYITNQPCNCFGDVLELSAGITVGIDLCVIGISLWNLMYLGMALKKIVFNLVLATFLSIAGYLVAMR